MLQLVETSGYQDFRRNMKWQRVDKLIKYFLAQKTGDSELQPGPDCPSELKLSDFASGLLTPEENEKIRRHLDKCIYCLEQIEQVGRWFKAGAEVNRTEPPPGLLRRAKALTEEEREMGMFDDSVRTGWRNVRPGADEFRLCCRKCDTLNPPQSRYCRFCGSQLKVLVCPACGRALVGGSRFCSYCGRNVPEAGRISPPIRAKNKVAGFLAWIKRTKWLLGALIALFISFFSSKYFLQFLLIAAVLGIKWIFDAGATRTLIMIYEAWRQRDRGEAERSAQPRRTSEKGRESGHR